MPIRTFHSSNLRKSTRIFWFLKSRRQRVGKISEEFSLKTTSATLCGVHPSNRRVLDHSQDQRVRRSYPRVAHSGNTLGRKQLQNLLKDILLPGNKLKSAEPTFWEIESGAKRRFDWKKEYQKRLLGKKSSLTRTPVTTSNILPTTTAQSRVWWDCARGDGRPY